MTFSKDELGLLSKTASDAAIAAGQYIQSQLHENYDQKRKTGSNSLASQVVTSVDIKAQQIILACLQPSIKKYDLGLLTEESADDASRLEKPYFWCVDPLDGTLAFTKNRSGYAVSIALIDKSGDPVIGAVYVPDLKDCYIAVKGNGVVLNDQPFRHKESDNQQLDFYMDRSLKNGPYYKQINDKLESWAANQGINQINYHANYGAVRNALGVMHSAQACYFKLPKKRPGGGSIWDFATTRLFFEELGLQVSNAKGEILNLNKPETTFMNRDGVMYATHKSLAEFIISLIISLRVSDSID